MAQVNIGILFEKLKSRLSNKMSEVMTIMRPENTNEEMFSYLWSLDEAHATLTPVLHPSSKSKDESYVHCKQGDIAYRLHDLVQALSSYNLAILSAPHPDTITDSPKNSGKDKYEELAQAYESRSVVLYDLKQYTKCSDDIDRALELGCVQSRRKLLDRKSICLKLISEGKDKAFDASAEALNTFEPCFAYINREPPKLADHNPAIPSLSSAVKLAYTHSQGRHLIADRDINPGDIVSVEDGYCSTLYSEKLLMYCTVCMKRCTSPLPCPSCKEVIFCSEECQKQGLSSIHWQECPIVSTLRLLDIKSFLALAYRLMIKTSHAKLKEMIPLLQCETKDQPLKNLGFNKNGVYDSSDYSAVYHLTTNKEKIPGHELFVRCMEAFVVTKLLLLSGRYFISCDGEPFTPSHEDIVLTGSTLIHHMMVLHCNSLCIAIPIFNVNGHKERQMELCGRGVHSASSLLNHSCNPNCSDFWYGTTLLVRAILFIPAGKPLTFSYGLDVAVDTRDSRRLKLMTHFKFSCTCEACENNWPTIWEWPTFYIIKCTKCNEGEGINPRTKVCPNCNLNYDKGGMQGRAPYNYRLISKKMQKVHEDFLIANKNILEEGSNSEKDIKAVRALIKLFCKYVKQPSLGLRLAQEALCVFCLRRCSCVYVKHDTGNTLINLLSAEMNQALQL
ncbi:SET and MYND domain-containing protein 4 [Procambarus clarkii]|uniref:SET and MYND domain-containing protein 4 n=1 Tax=Procambarus clarkii TaxID=6728 RepID=UPI001E678454|nr:SET and MYND domain-containing protein 4-like [Procambarus clarkii]